jgi:hypothetical protein
LGIFGAVVEGSHKAKVAQFGFTILVYEYVGGFYISVDEAGRVEVKQGFCHLIEDVFSVSFSEDVFADECEEIDVHMFEDEIDISVILGANHLLQLDYIGMRQFHQEHYFAIGPLCVGRVIEGVKIFL